MTAPLTPGKVRGLTATSTPEGVFTILAVDHRDSMRVVLDPDDPAGVPAARLTEVKLGLLRALAAEASAVLLDPEYSIAPAIAARAVPGSVGFLAAVEAQGYLGDPAARQNFLLEGWSVEKAKRTGASGIKLLVLYRPDADIADAQDELIRGVVADCAAADIPLFLEPLLYGEEPGERRRLVVETVRRLGALGPEVLKVQFPVDTRHEPDRAVWADACAELHDASPVPWALLSGGDPYELFREQVQVACAAGASGFMVGRALWREAVLAAPQERAQVIDVTVRPRFRELAAIAVEHARDWAADGLLPDWDNDWLLRGY